MKSKNFLKVLFALVLSVGLVSCKKDQPAASSPVGSNSSEVSAPVGDLPSIVFEKDVKQFVGGWTYITNNPQYPDAGWYSDGGLKFNFEGQGVLSPVFSGGKSHTVTLKVNALNENTKTAAASEDTFTVYGLDSAGAEVAHAGVKVTAAGDVAVTISGSANIAQVKVIFSGYPNNGSKYCNVSLGGVTVA